MEKSSQNKQPVYKKWWFWLIVVVVIGGIGSQAKDNDAKKVSETPSSSSQTQQAEKTDFKVGDVIAFDGKEVAVEKVQRNWSADNKYLKPKDGKEYVKISVRIENKSDEQISYNTFDWKIEDANGSVEGPSFMAYSNSDSLESGELVKGGKKAGSLVFEVTKGTTLKIHYQPLFWSSKKVVINL